MLGEMQVEIGMGVGEWGFLSVAGLASILGVARAVDRVGGGEGGAGRPASIGLQAGLELCAESLTNGEWSASVDCFVHIGLQEGRL